MSFATKLNAINIFNQEELGRLIQELIDADQLHLFYTSTPWLHLRAEVLNEYNHECQTCKSKGLYSKATHVHHVKWIRRYPHLALSKTYLFEGKEYKNLIPLCHSCHEDEHDRKLKQKKELLTEEWW